MVSGTIPGVTITPLDKREDERGWLTEVLRKEELGDRSGFGQFYMAVAVPGAVRGNHYHARKQEWFCVIRGKGLLVLEDNDTGLRQEVLMGDGNLVTVKIPAGVSHAITNVGQEPMYLLAYVDEPFQDSDPDTFRRKVI